MRDVEVAEINLEAVRSALESYDAAHGQVGKERPGALTRRSRPLSRSHLTIKKEKRQHGITTRHHGSTDLRP